MKAHVCWFFATCPQGHRVGSGARTEVGIQSPNMARIPLLESYLPTRVSVDRKLGQRYQLNPGTFIREVGILTTRADVHPQMILYIK